VSYTETHPPTHQLECTCGGRVSVDMGRLTPFIEGLFTTYHDGDGHHITETINDTFDEEEANDA